MAFYDLSKQKRAAAVLEISNDILNEFLSGKLEKTIAYFDDADTYIRKSAYLSVGRIYFVHKELQTKIIKLLKHLLLHNSYKIRQTVINAAGEIGKTQFSVAQYFF